MESNSRVRESLAGMRTLLRRDSSGARRPDAASAGAIVGGESGPGARECNLDGIRSIVRQCKAADVPCFVKQLGALSLGFRRLKDRKGADPSEWPEDLRVQKMPRAGGTR